MLMLMLILMNVLLTVNAETDEGAIVAEEEEINVGGLQEASDPVLLGTSPTTKPVPHPNWNVPIIQLNLFFLIVLVVLLVVGLVFWLMMKSIQPCLDEQKVLDWNNATWISKKNKNKKKKKNT